MKKVTLLIAIISVLSGCAGTPKPPVPCDRFTATNYSLDASTNDGCGKITPINRY